MISRIFKLINIYLMSWALVFTPNTFANGVATQDQVGVGQHNGANYTKTECDDDPARECDTRLNRCIYTGESVEDRDEYRECAKIEDDEERKACHDQYAQNRAGELNNEDEGNWGMGLAGINAALAAINWLGAKKGSTCTSRTMFQAAAVGAVIGEAYFQLMAKKKLEEIVKKYKKEAVMDDPFAAQVRAFEYLKDEQEAIKKYSKRRKTYYMVLAGFYLIIAAYATYETFSPTAEKCVAFNKPEKRKLDFKEQLLELLFPSAYAAKKKKRRSVPQTSVQGLTLNHVGLSTSQVLSVDTAISSMQGTATTSSIEHGPVKTPFFDRFFMDIIFPKAHAWSLTSSPAIAITSAISAGLAFKLMNGAQKQMEEAEENIKLIDKVLEKFKSALAGFCPNGRDDLTNPRCYCYTEDNKRNSNRSNSETCQSLWAMDDQNLFNDGQDYMGARVAQPGCVTVSNQYDPDCKCRRFKNQNGLNACLKTSLTPNNFDPNLSSAMQLPKVNDQLNGMYDGSTLAGTVGGSTLTNQLANAKRVKDQLKKQFDAKSKANGGKGLPSDEKLTSAFLKKLKGNPAFLKAQGAGNKIVSARPNSMKKALQEAAKKAGLKKGITYSGKTNLASRGKAKKDKFNFSLDDGAGGVKIQGPADVMDENFDYAQNDISQDDGVSIFKIISNRYIVSGLKRLFGEEILEDEVEKEDE